jgi:2,3-bisphosphoglycerate-dependent phosphoglycerate mutase
MRYLLLLILVSAASCGNTYFIVRHAEKAVAGTGMGSDVPLSPEGEQRAIELRQLLKDKKVQYIFSTNFKRTISTAQPLNELRGNTRIEIYNPSKDSADAFIQRLRSIKKGNVLVVGHSNTIDDIANKLCGKTVVPGDLKDVDYDNLFVVKKKGNRYVFTGKKYGAPPK